MKLLCGKCSQPLTIDLYKKKVHWVKYFYRFLVKNHKDIFDNHGRIKKGLFFYSKSSPSMMNYVESYDNPDKYEKYIIKKEPSLIVIGMPSLLDGIIPEFKTGYGCCHYSMGENLYCECGQHLGHMYLDCYEDGSVEFITKNVELKY